MSLSLGSGKKKQNKKTKKNLGNSVNNCSLYVWSHRMTATTKSWVNKHAIYDILQVCTKVFDCLYKQTAFVHALCTQNMTNINKHDGQNIHMAAILKQFNHMTTLKCYSTEILLRVGLLHTLQYILLHITYEPHPMKVQHYNTSSVFTIWNMQLSSYLGLTLKLAVLTCVTCVNTVLMLNVKILNCTNFHTSMYLFCTFMWYYPMKILYTQKLTCPCC